MTGLNQVATGATPETAWTSTLTHRCRDCFGTVQVVEFRPQPHECEPRTCDIGDCDGTAVAIIAAHTRQPDKLTGPGAPGVTLLCDRHFSTAPIGWDNP